MKTKTLRELAEYIGGRVIGDPDVKIKDDSNILK